MTSQSPRDDSVRPKRRRKRPRRRRNPLLIGASVAGFVLVVVAVVWTAVHFSRPRPGDPRLIGTWQSDADATIAELRNTRPLTDEQDAKLRTLFGKMKVTYTETTITTDFEGKVDTQPYQVVSKDGDTIMVKSWSALSKQDEVYRIRFVGTDRYWVDVERFAMSECFRRIG